MPVFNIFIEKSLGFSHSGEVCASGDGNVELTDIEVQELVDLIREKGVETDVEKLGLEERYPEIYKKLDEACGEIAHNAEYHHWIVEGYENGYYEISTDEAIEKCEEQYGFEYEFDMEKFLEENPDYEEEDIDEDVIDEAKEEAFKQWVGEYRSKLDDYHEALFLDEVFELNPCIDSVDYEVEIPVDIVNMAMDDNQ